MRFPQAKLSVRMLLCTGLLGFIQPAISFANSDEPEILYWVAPMDPNYRRDAPGKSPMGMDLIPVYAEDQESADESGLPTVRIAPMMVNNLGVRTEPVAQKNLARRIETVGYIDFDENRVSHVHLRIEGWIEKLRVRSVGERVRKGDLLFQVYSPQLVNAQEEYLQALQSGSQRMLTASRERLLALGVPQSLVKSLNKQRRVQQLISIYARQDGVVAELKVREGMYVKPASEIMTLADLSTVWILVDVFERQADWVRLGQQAEVSLPYLPGKLWEGRVEYIYPSLDAKTRTLKVRLRFDNPGEQLKPNMYANAVILAQPKRDVLSIPREALIRSGGTERVVVARGEGRFQPVEVKAGIESGELVEIVQGLSAGDRVVVSSQFLIDSESSLKASFRRMSEPEPMEPEAEAEHAAVEASGVIDARLDDGRLTVTHEPIEALGWPSMTMDFELADGVDSSSFEAGTPIRFSLMEVGEYQYRITALEPVVTEFRARGVVNALLLNQRKLNISHEPIEALGWPAMTMDLALADEVSFKGLTAGQKIDFVLRQLDEVTYVISSLSPVAE